MHKLISKWLARRVSAAHASPRAISGVPPENPVRRDAEKHTRDAYAPRTSYTRRQYPPAHLAGEQIAAFWCRSSRSSITAKKPLVSKKTSLAIHERVDLGVRPPPLAAPFDWLLAALKNTGLSAKQDGDSVNVSMESSPRELMSLHRPTEPPRLARLPEKFAAFLAESTEILAVANEAATSGALTNDSGQIFVGSRSPSMRTRTQRLY